MEETRLWLSVPFAEKEQAARLGAIWCSDHGSWFVPDILERSRFARWAVHERVAP